MQLVLITGTSKGLGRELARAYLQMGYSVIGVSRTEPGIESGEYRHLTADLTGEDVEMVLGRFLKSLQIETIDILINNAGQASSGARLSTTNPAEVMYQMELHCIAALRVIKAAQAFLNHSKIVNITSRLGSMVQNLRGDFADKDFSYSYRIAKAAQNMLSLCLMHDTEINGNTIISVNPGLLLTDSGAEDAVYTAAEGAEAVVSIINKTSCSGIYHAFDGEALH